jgi:hypothetical protein
VQEVDGTLNVHGTLVLSGLLSAGSRVARVRR